MPRRPSAPPVAPSEDSSTPAPTARSSPSRRSVPNATSAAARRSGPTADCKFFSSPSGCRYGDRCRFVHATTSSGSTSIASGTADGSSLAPLPNDNADPNAKVAVCPKCKLELQREGSDNGWACDGRNEPGGCVKGCTGFSQTSGWIRYRCGKDDFDYCEGCYGRARDTNGLSRRAVRVRAKLRALKSGESLENFGSNRPSSLPAAATPYTGFSFGQATPAAPTQERVYAIRAKPDARNELKAFLDALSQMDRDRLTEVRPPEVYDIVLD